MTQAFLRSAWYAAARPAEVGRTPLRRVFLNEPVVLFRTESGEAVALRDVCPHRFAPLSKGRLEGDDIACPYHGLRFGADGHCTRNPHAGDAQDKARVKAYPLLERFEMIWIWMGDPAEASPQKLPDFSSFGTRYRVFSGYTTVAVDYRLLIDNIMDGGAHVDFVHPALAVQGDFKRKTEVRQEGDTIHSRGWWLNAKFNAFMKEMWGHADGGDIFNFVRWDAPALVYLEAGVKIDGKVDDSSPVGPAAHLFTPETERTSHYLWMVGVKQEVNDPKIEEFIRSVGNQAFELEDSPVIESAQVNMGDHDLLELAPISFPSDAAALRCRRVLARKIEEERTGSGLRAE